MKRNEFIRLLEQDRVAAISWLAGEGFDTWELDDLRVFWQELHRDDAQFEPHCRKPPEVLLKIADETVGEWDEDDEEPLQLPILVGSRVSRMLGGQVLMPLTVTGIDDELVHCGTWTFSRRNGAEIDATVGWTEEQSGTYLKEIVEDGRRVGGS